jgi:hypothetical protein
VGDIGPAAVGGEDEVPRRERLRWEKELLGLYLSEHPLGDIADQLPEYVTAYTGELAEESDQAKVTLGGIIQGTRRVITRAGATMLVANVEDLQGSVEVVVFPKVFAETANAWAEDSVVLVTGRVDHRDEEAQLLCEAVHAWDDAVRMGPVAFSAERDRLLRGRGRPGGPGSGAASAERSAPEPTTPFIPVARPRGAETPLPPAPPAPADEADDEPPAPRDAVPLQAVPVDGSGMIAIGFDDEVGLERLLPAIELVTAAVRERPGPLPVVLNVPVAGATRQIRLPHRSAWDERLAETLGEAAGVALAVELRPSAVEG